MNKKIIGIAGVGRSGKDTLCDYMIKCLGDNGIVAKRFAIADELKRQLYPFIMDQYGIDLYECSNEEKELIRGLMVEWGLIHRVRSEGTYLTDIVQNDIDCAFENEKIDVAIITDIRYQQYEKDEVYWLREKNNGKLVHVSKIIGHTNMNLYSDSTNTPVFQKPASEQEEINDPILRKLSDVRLIWETKQEEGDPITKDIDDYYKNNAYNVLVDLDFLGKEG